MRNSITSVTLVLLSACSCFAQPRQYTLISDSPHFDGSPYGFSGTITTDGSIGSFTDVNFITDWSITLTTPGNAEVLTPVDGSFEVSHSEEGDFVVTATDISIQNVLLNNIFGRTRLRLGDVSGDGAEIQWMGPTERTFDPGPFGLIFVSDGNGNGDIHVGWFGDLQALTVATGGVVIPEPSSFLALSLGALGLTCVLCNRRQTRKPQAHS